MDESMPLKDVMHFLELLNEMDVPEDRKDDLDWLNTNLHVRNKDHPKFEEANDLLDKLLRSRSESS